MFLISCQPARLIWHNFADIGDHKIFPSHQLTASSAPFRIPSSAQSFLPENFYSKTKYKSFEDFLEKSNTVALLIIKDDSLLSENYSNNYNRNSIVPSFSIAKSYTSALVGIAIEEGLIKSVDEKVTDYLPELKKNGFDKVTIKHLLQMTSGIKFNENYKSPFSEASSFYYGTDLRKLINKIEIIHEPGTHFNYVSGNTQLLAHILEKALNGKTISEYLNEKIWQPLGMEYDASWSIDSKKNNMEKAFCCINARAIDFAKFGMLYLNKGKWNGRQIIPKHWIEESTKTETSDASPWYYQYQWRKVSPESKEFYAAGWLGQYIYINPEKKLVIVRLGENFGDVNWIDIFSNYSKSLN